MSLMHRNPALWRRLAVPYLGQIATRAFACDQHNAGKTAMMSQSAHTLRDNAAAIRVTIPNWCLGGNATGSNNANGEVIVAGGQAITVEGSAASSASGPWTRFQWNGSATGTVATLSDLTSDWLPFPAIAGARLYLRFYLESSTGLYTTSGNINAAFGDLCNYGAIGSVANVVDGGAITTNTASNNSFYPGEILGMTTRPSVGIIGDSRALWVNDTADSSGDMGEIARSVGPAFAYTVLAKRTRSVAQFNLSHGLQVARLAHVSHVINQLGVNGFINESRTLSQLQSDLLALYASLPAGKPVFQSTLTPVSTGANAQADGSDQTASYQPQLSQINDWIRANAAGIAGCFEVADVVEISRNSGKWKAGYSGDLTHGNQAAMLTIRNGNAIDVSRIRR